MLPSDGRHLSTPCILYMSTARALWERILRQGQNLIRDSNPAFRINPYPNPDVCRIIPVIYWIHSLGVSHFATLRKNQSVTVRNANKAPKIPYCTVVREMEKWSGIRIRDHITTKSESLVEGQPLPMPTMFGRRPLPRPWVILLTERQTEWQNMQNERPHYSASVGGVTANTDIVAGLDFWVSTQYVRRVVCLFFYNLARIIMKSWSLLESHLLPMPTMFGRRPLSYSQNDRQSDRTTDHITPPASAE